MRDILKEYIETELTLYLAKQNLEQIRSAYKKGWAEVDLSSNMHDITANLKDKNVNVSGIMADDPELSLSLDEFKDLMNKRLEKLFCEKGKHLILIQDLNDSENKTLAVSGEEFLVEDIIGFGFDLVHLANPELCVRVINSDMEIYFRVKNYP